MSTRSIARCAGLAALGLALGSMSVGADASSLSTTNRLAKIPVPGKPLKSFDIGWTDPSMARYYVADRSNSAVDVVDTSANAVVKQIGGFVGFTGNNDTSGPDGVVSVSHSELWVGDGDSTVKVLDVPSGSIVATISTGGKARADELAFDTTHGLIVVANDADEPPYLTSISVGGRAVVKKLAYPDATDGLEQPVFDPTTGMIYQAVPGTKDLPGGAIDAIDPVQMTITQRFPLTNCAPHGLALGPNHQALVGCSKALHTIVIDDTNGNVLADFTQTGGSDEVWYNPGENRYYLAENAAQSLGVIDAGTLTFIENVETGLGAHSVAADAINNHIFVPIATPDPACPNGCIAVFASVTGDRGTIPASRRQ